MFALVIFIAAPLPGSCPAFTLTALEENARFVFLFCFYYYYFIFNMLAVYYFDPNPVDCLELVLGEKTCYVAALIGSDSSVVY